MTLIHRALIGAGLASVVGSAMAGITCQPVASGEIFIAPITNPGKISPTDGTCFVNGLKLTTHDGVKLTANVFLPKITSADQKFPTIIMVNSWVMPDWEYIGQAQRLAKDGYIVYEYASRGWWQSEGVTQVASPDDVKDVSDAMDWLIANTPAKSDAVAVSGISYGSGIALLALAREPRLKTAVALSTWANLEDEFYGGETANKSNMNLLVDVAPIAGNLDPAVPKLRDDLLNPDTPQSRIDEIRAWSKVRSPLQELTALNARKAPVFIGKNYSDEMFNPNNIIKFFAQLQGPKKLLLNNGWHAVPELPGALLGSDNYIYDQAHRWFDYWLKGSANGIVSEPQVDMEVQNVSAREKLATWPDSTVKTFKYNIAPRGDLRFDVSCWCAKGATGYLQSATSTMTATDSISSLFDTVASTGIPVASELLTGFGLFTTASMPLVLRDNGVVYNGPNLSSALKIRGMAQLQLNVRPTKSQGQVLAYLYDVDDLGIGTLISHGARSVHTATAGQTISYPIDMHMAAYTVPAGHHLSLVLDTQDAHYAPASNSTFGMDFMFSSSLLSSLTIPYIN